MRSVGAVLSLSALSLISAQQYGRRVDYELEYGAPREVEYDRYGDSGMYDLYNAPGESYIMDNMYDENSYESPIYQEPIYFEDYAATPSKETYVASNPSAGSYSATAGSKDSIYEAYDNMYSGMSHDHSSAYANPENLHAVGYGATEMAEMYGEEGVETKYDTGKISDYEGSYDRVDKAGSKKGPKQPPKIYMGGERGLGPPYTGDDYGSGYSDDKGYGYDKPRRYVKHHKKHYKSKGYDRGYDRGYDKPSAYDDDKGYDKGYDKPNDNDKGYDKGYDKPSAYDDDKGYDKGYDKPSAYDNDKGYDKGYDKPSAYHDDKGYGKSEYGGYKRKSKKRSNYKKPPKPYKGGESGDGPIPPPYKGEDYGGYSDDKGYDKGFDDHKGYDDKSYNDQKGYTRQSYGPLPPPPKKPY